MCRRKVSPARAVFKQDREARNAFRKNRRSTRQLTRRSGGSSDLQRPLGNRDQLRDGGITVYDGQSAATSDRSQMLAEASLQISYANGLHSHMIVMTGHEGNPRRVSQRVDTRYLAQGCP